MASGYSISKAAQLTGLTPFLIRAWENRYAVVRPGRNEGGQRRYSDEDVEHLRILSRLVEQGHRIGEVAGMSPGDLRKLLESEEAPALSDYIDRAMGCTMAFDAPGLQAVLTEAVETLGVVDLADRVLFPFMDELGRSWHEDRVEVLHEHMASSVLQSLLGNLLSKSIVAMDAPRAVTAVPPGQEHGIGAMCCALALRAAGWDARCLGTHIPAPEMLRAVRETRAGVLVLSIVFPRKKSPVAEALTFLEKELDPDVRFLVGGVSAGAFMSVSRERIEKTPRSMRALKKAFSLSSVGTGY